MSVGSMPTRQQIERAEPLEFTTARPERQANITIEISPAGLVVKAEYTGTLGSIPAAIEKLRADGVLQLVEASRPAAAPAPAAISQVEKKPAAKRVQPEYNDAGEACCPKHHKVLKAGQWGLYCPAKDNSTERGYCSIKFTD